jgi:hypothetical protein
VDLYVIIEGLLNNMPMPVRYSEPCAKCNVHSRIDKEADYHLNIGVYSASDRNEYQKHKNNISGE